MDQPTTPSTSGIDIKKSGRTLGSELTAPTPNNTPSVQAPISAFRKPPTATAGAGPVIPEEPESVTATAPVTGDLFAQNAQLVSMLQGKLGSLINAPSGYVSSLPRNVRRRILALKALNRQHIQLEHEFHREVLALEKKYNQLYAPVRERRAKIVTGEQEATEEDVKHGKLEDEEVTDDDEQGAEDDPSVTGIPEFWLTAFKNHPMLVEWIQEKDEEALKHLRDVRVDYLPDQDKPGFQLVFDFDHANPCFTNSSLVKTYYYKLSENMGDLVFDASTGTDIAWRDGKDLSVTTQTKRQRNKVTKAERVITTTVPDDTFFNFFKPPKLPELDSDDEEDDEEMEARAAIMQDLEEDYAIGEEFKDKIVPHAVDWFTGKALEYEGLDLDEDDEDFSDQDGEESDDDDESD